MQKLLFLAIAMALLNGCVAKRYLTQSQNHVVQLQADSTNLQTKVYAFQKQVADMQSNILDLNQKITNLNNQIGDLGKQNTQLGQKNTEQQSLLAQNRKALEASQQNLTQSQKDLADKQQRLQQLEDLLTQQKAALETLKNKMTDALKGYNTNDLSVIQKDGKIYVSLSENLLFPSGSAVVNQKGVDALAKLAAVLNLNPDVNIQIEGNTDSIPISGRYQDNWDLSTARANAIVRILVDKYTVNPRSVVSVGHSYYDPVDTNETPEGRAKNRRTDIVLSPNLQEMYKLLGAY